MTIEDGQEFFSQEATPGHPLKIAAATVVVGAVEPAPREACLDPAEQRFVVGVHAQGNLRLAAVAAKVSLADENADQEARSKSAMGLFHRQVSRETLPCRSVRGCFTVKFPVKHPVRQAGRQPAVRGVESPRWQRHLPELSAAEFRSTARVVGLSGCRGSVVEALHAHYQELRRWAARVALVGAGEGADDRRTALRREPAGAAVDRGGRAVSTWARGRVSGLCAGGGSAAISTFWLFESRARKAAFLRAASAARDCPAGLSMLESRGATV